MQSIFGTDGIRGRFDKDLTFSLAYKVGFALGNILQSNNPIIIGRDTRISGEILLEAISKGISESGKEYIDIGICPTPAIPFLIRKENFSSGLMISASHNPPEFNGIKIFDNSGKKIRKELENKIQSTIMEIDGTKLVKKKSIGLKTNTELLDIYIQSLIKTMGGENLNGMKIILDTCYGSATTCAKEVFMSLGANVEVINNENNGLKINLNCGSTHLEPIKKAVTEKKADMGFSFDGDADRVIGVDSEGNVLDGDHILFLWGRELLEKKLLTNNLLISTKMANLGFENAWNNIGGIMHRTEVGDKFIYDAIHQKDAILGGEQSGHILSKTNDFNGDGILTAIQISKFCKNKKISLRDWLRSSFKAMPQKLTNLNLDFVINKNQVHEIIQKYSNTNYENCRVFIRPSGTEPLLRILVEAKNMDIVNNISNEITSKLNEEIKKLAK